MGGAVAEPPLLALLHVFQQLQATLGTGDAETQAKKAINLCGFNLPRQMLIKAQDEGNDDAVDEICRGALTASLREITGDVQPAIKEALNEALRALDLYKEYDTQKPAVTGEGERSLFGGLMRVLMDAMDAARRKETSGGGAAERAAYPSCSSKQSSASRSKAGSSSLPHKAGSAATHCSQVE